MIKIAFATTDGRTVNAHFGLCDAFTVYELDANRYEELPERSVVAPLGIDSGDNSRIEQRVTAIRDCTLVYINQIGAAAAARVTRSRIMPVKVDEGSSIQTHVEKLMEVLRGKPPIWLAKAMAGKKEVETADE
ncbi:NifB/NifX family molybdenum-iron cluster-binding protein [Gorillibacterium massiliense]|uniref:NifB/NifX family molybdenum-iron cluster-binding protein n=1 Tax=Gorillibacterium massiliense TaxID=1280390 RepID=UPI0004B6C9ED|nr:NifB/NifX family molybdenum-iron cluster-binding protein [Gorillibacterium massiliense]